MNGKMPHRKAKARNRRPRVQPVKTGETPCCGGQMLFCTVVLLVALAARMMGLPFYPELRRTFAQAMQPEQDFFPEHRALLL